MNSGLKFLSLILLIGLTTATASAQTYNFTTCGAEGRTGPSQSQCDSAYSGTDLEGEVNIVGEGIQDWTVPEDGYYRFEVAGAAGGDASSNSAEGGHGASLKGTFQLEQGMSIRLLVGQKGTGEGSSNGDSASGGGGTFVTRYDSDYTPLIVAAAGGGANEVTDGRPGSSTLTNDDTGGAGDKGGGGGGYRTDGQDGEAGTGGQAFLNGGVGGNGEAVNGGFGGGGGDGGFNSCGGAGGYSGGSGHNYDSNCGGGGFSPAESFNDGENTTGESGVNPRHGYVKVRSLNDTESDFCNFRGPVNECIMNQTNQLNNQQYNISSIFESRENAVFEAFDGPATLNLTNSSRISGLWRGAFNLDVERPVLQAGAEFRPEGRIVIGR